MSIPPALEILFSVVIVIGVVGYTFYIAYQFILFFYAVYKALMSKVSRSNLSQDQKIDD